ncbi:nuclear transport factor 2 family protein [Asanoa siamensis]|uniref:DUF4440 domain-containing protein n=1 Tax=Asanoa siamensis TaxID=926357 RepID=A0ABQ4D599_9ACTN|nr:nuclear transport factor 2 family protein [Asanoa siamensis]GIF78292.1 hypothetical protein Asi02nite_78100 [Asanoa siamensis]
MGDLTLEDMLSVEHDGWRSLCESRGGTFYGDLMTDDGLMLVSDGTVFDRDGITATLNQAPPWTTYTIDEPRVVSLGPATAALIYRARSHREGAAPFTALMTSVYRLIDGRLRLALYQQTPTER